MAKVTKTQVFRPNQAEAKISSFDQKPAVRIWETAQRQATDNEGPAGKGHSPQQTTHITHVLGVEEIQITVTALSQGQLRVHVHRHRAHVPKPAMFVKDSDLMANTMAITVFMGMCTMEAMLDTMNHTAGAKEQERLEKGMGNQMEEASAISADTQGSHHVAQLADGRIGQDPLDIPLRNRNCRSKEGGKGADKGDKVQYPRRRTPAAKKSGNIRMTRKTPAETIVAAWIMALTGVGPSMASGNQTCSGNCALLPIVPKKSKIAISASAGTVTFESGTVTMCVAKRCRLSGRIISLNCRL